MTDLNSIINYFKISEGAYSRWGGGIDGPGGYHITYYDDTNIDFRETQPEEVYKSHMKSQIRMLEVVTKLVDPQRGEIIVDAGCGVGAILPYLARSSKKVIGFNIDDTHIRKARRRIKKENIDQSTSVIKCDYHTMPFKDSSIDKILFHESLTFSQEPEVVLTEAKRVLKNNGKVCIVEMMLVNSYNALGRARKEVETLNKGMALRATSYPELYKTLTTLGFKIWKKDITENTFPSMQLGAASAEAHQNDKNVSEELQGHRNATIAYRDLTERGDMKYYLMKAT